MKFKVTSIAVLVSVSMMCTKVMAVTPSAQELESKVFSSVFVEKHWNDGRKSRSTDWLNTDYAQGFGFDIGYRINQTWALRAEYARQSFNSLTQRSNISGGRFGVDVMYHLANSNLYLVAGIKHLDNSAHVDAITHSDAVNIGMGYRYFLNQSTALFVEANRLRGLNNGNWNDASIKAGLTYAFGVMPLAAAPTAAPQPITTPIAIDSDGDGVPDSQDKCPNTPATHKVDSEGCTVYSEMMDRVDDVKLEVRFAFDSTDVSESGRAEVNQLAEFMKRFPEAVVFIEGHASNIGNPDYNMRLSELRAKAIAKLLIAEGIDNARITSMGFGVTQPRVQGNTREAHIANQRTEAKVTAKVKAPVLR